MDSERSGRAGARRRACGWLIAGLSVCVLLLAAGIGPKPGLDAWMIGLLIGPAVAAMIAAAVWPAPRMPSSVLLSRSGDGAWEGFIRPYLVPLLATPLALFGGAYLGAGLSLLAAVDGALGSVLFDNGGYLEWWDPLFGLLIGVLGGYVLVLALVVPMRVAVDARRSWSQDRAEALRKLAFVVLWTMLMAAGTAMFVAYPPEDGGDTDQLESVRQAAMLLIGRPPAGTPWWAVGFGWAAVLLGLAGCGLLARSRALRRSRSEVGTGPLLGGGS
ncbi:hypothetical protein [Luteipulveratus flavus]|uniref:Uncharacterized protein n=1 Tax=Luteipulveratus flavus TaxID=3031728 RepID=A0ABT6C2C3_9MICO|nr:hypothetical protein [Luteipulveratus sp. YIM 133296]MDF8262776.1 hypothetical protein [Luteipulveratus sp. YIM 133296]